MAHPPGWLNFVKMKRDATLDGKATVGLKTPTPEEAAKLNEAREMPDGG